MRNLIIFGDTPFAERLFKYISIEAKDKIIAFTQEKSFVSRKEIQVFLLSHSKNFNFISTNTVFGGNARIENNCFFGLHSTVKEGVTIASNKLYGFCANFIKSISYTGGGGICR